MAKNNFSISYEELVAASGPQEPDALNENNSNGPMLVPQKMAFQQYKTPPWKVAWLGGTIALALAKKNAEARKQQFESLQHSSSPGPESEMQHVRQITDSANSAAPEPTPHFAPDDQVRQVRLSSDEITEYGQDYECRIQECKEEKMRDLAKALQEVKVQSTRYEMPDFIPQFSPWDFLGGD